MKLLRLVCVAAAIFQFGCASINSSSAKDSAAQASVSNASALKSYELANPPSIGRDANGRELFLGGFSGLIYEGKNKETGVMSFLTHTDRGPNGKEFEAKNGQGLVIPFPLPKFQPEWIRVSLDPKTGLTVVSRTPLTDKKGQPVSGIPNRPGDALGAGFDERPVDLSEVAIKADPMGLDLEGVVRDTDGSYWMVEEYRPSILHFNADGRMLDRFVPNSGRGDDKKFGTPVLPKAYALRRSNRGFEAVTFHNGKVYAFVQSPLDNPDTKDDSTSTSSLVVRILEFDARSKKPTGEYAYLLDDNTSDRKLGDAVALPNGDFLVLEQTSKTGKKADKKIYRVSLKGATNLLAKGAVKGLGKKTLEVASAEERTKAGVQAVQKNLAVDLVQLGFDFAGKAEGMALVDSETIAIATDNDFQLKDPEPSRIVLIKIKALD